MSFPILQPYAWTDKILSRFRLWRRVISRATNSSAACLLSPDLFFLSRKSTRWRGKLRYCCCFPSHPRSNLLFVNAGLTPEPLGAGGIPPQHMLSVGKLLGLLHRCELRVYPGQNSTSLLPAKNNKNKESGDRMAACT